jgi:hypothetical protein
MVADDPKRLIMTIRKGKTGYRSSNTMPAAVSVYERICERSSERHPDEYLFLPEYTNRTTASQIMRRQFNALLKRAGLEVDPYTGKSNALYSLRHTAICMRIIILSSEYVERIVLRYCSSQTTERSDLR